MDVLLGLLSFKGRSFGATLLMSLFLSPFLGYLYILAVPAAQKGVKRCPRCYEDVKKEAEVCRFCGYDFYAKLNLDRET